MIELILMTERILNIPPLLLLALCSVESNLQPHAINHLDGNSASYGICQVKLSTAHEFEKVTLKELMQPDINIRIAGKYLLKQLKRYNNDLEKAVSAYNMGTAKNNKKGYLLNHRYVTKVTKRRYKFYGALRDAAIIKRQGFRQDKRTSDKAVEGPI